MIRRATIAAVLSLLTAGSACADDASDAVRAEFKRAYAIAIADGDTGHVPAPVTDSKTLRDYILYPYLQQARLHRAMSDTQSDTAALDGEVANFLHAHENETVSVELRRAWYTHLSRRMAWEKLLEE